MKLACAGRLWCVLCQMLGAARDSYEQATSDTRHATAIRGFTRELAERLGVLKP